MPVRAESRAGDGAALKRQAGKDQRGWRVGQERLCRQSDAHERQDEEAAGDHPPSRRTLRRARRRSRSIGCLAEPRQLVGQVPGALPPCIGVFREALPDHAIDRHRDAGSEAAHCRRIDVENRHHRASRGTAIKGAASGQHLEQHGAEREDIGSSVSRLAFHLLGSHVRDSAEHDPLFRHWIPVRRRRNGDAIASCRAAIRIQTRQPEVQNLNA